MQVTMELPDIPQEILDRIAADGKYVKEINWVTPKSGEYFQDADRWKIATHCYISTHPTLILADIQPKLMTADGEELEKDMEVWYAYENNVSPVIVGGIKDGRVALRFLPGGVHCLTIAEASADLYAHAEIKLGKKKRWKPKHGEYYYIINESLRTLREQWFDDFHDMIEYKVGNCFKTSEEAEAAIPEFKKRLAEFNEEKR